jgi:hypothetical protein
VKGSPRSTNPVREKWPARRLQLLTGRETHLSRKRVPVTQSTILSSGPINGGDALTIEMIQPESMPAVVRIVWPTAATITTPRHYLEVASAAMRLLAEASTTLARIRASRRL